MALGKSARKKSTRRLKKSGADRRRRQKVHRTRLIALGGDAKAVHAMNPKEVRTALNAKRKAVAKVAAKAKRA